MKRDLFDKYEIPDEYTQFGRFGKLAWYTEHQLNEGLITTYSFSSLITHLNKKYKNIITHIQSDPFSEVIKSDKVSGISFYIKSNSFDDNLLTQIKKDVDVYGYFIAFYEKYNDDEIGIFIEPKYPVLVDRKYLKNKKFYHITHKNFLEKIEKIGLTPRDSQTNFYHTGNRIYLMGSLNSNFINSFKQTLGKRKNWNPDDIITLEITPDINTDFYIDPNFDNKEVSKNTAIFTLKNIPPNRITILDYKKDQ